MAVKIGEETKSEEVEVEIVEENETTTNVNIISVGREEAIKLAIRPMDDDTAKEAVPSIIVKDGKVYRIKGANCFNKNEVISYELLAQYDEDIAFINAILDRNFNYNIAKAVKEFKASECVELFKKLNNTLYSSGYIVLLMSNIGYNGAIGVTPHFDNEDWVALWLNVNILYYNKFKSTPVLIKEVLTDPNYKSVEPLYEKIVVTTINNLKEKEVDDMVKSITSSGGSGGSAECGIGCYIGAGLALIAVGAALWWGYNNFIGDGVSDEPIAIPDNY